MQREVQFDSDGIRLAGVIETPQRAKGPRPAFVVIHGFGSSKDARDARATCEFLTGLGYVALRFDVRGCGESGGQRGHLLCLDQVADARNALSFMQGQPEVIPARIALAGSSFGAAVAIYTAGVDERAAAVVSFGGWGNGERKFRGQHPTPEAWEKFARLLEEGPRHRARTGESLMVSRYDIVPIPANLRAHVSPDFILKFPVETAQSMFDFRADDVVGRIAPRPLLLLHSAHDTVTPCRESVALFEGARTPTELHLFAQTDHFTFGEDKRVRQVSADWLARYFPAA
jgi:alpha-beta hydrolase superfamily lysophospholipase